MCTPVRWMLFWVWSWLLCAVGVARGDGGQGTDGLLVESPDGKITCVVSAGAQLAYSATWDARTIIRDAAIGISVDGRNLGSNARVVRKPSVQKTEETFPVMGVHAAGTARYNAATVALSSGDPAVAWSLEVRVFDDAVAYRYQVPGSGKRRVDGESSAWNLPAGSVLWSIGGKNRSYEDRFKARPVGEFTVGTEIMAVATAVLPGGGYAMLTEANVVNYSDMALLATGDNTFAAFFQNDQHGWTQESGGPVVSPWRVTLLAADLNALANTDVIRSLCPGPSADTAQTAYIRPGRSIWHWLTGGAPKLEEQQGWIDGTQEMGFEYYLVDDGWKRWRNGGESAWEALADLVRYAKARKVDLWAWVGAGEVFKPEDRQAYFQHAKRIGIVGLKIDFPKEANYPWVNWYDDTLRDAARAGLMVDFHGATKPSGRDRTWPNEMTREAIAGREQGRNPASHDTALPFTRYVLGNADYTPVLFDPGKLHGSSLAHELAMAVVYTSPFLCYGDNPRRYLASDAVEVLKRIPPVWEETRVLPGSRIGELAAFARRRGTQWFVGMINGANAHEEPVPLDFLGAGKYRLVELADSPDGNNAFRRAERIVTRDDVLRATLRKDGGYVAWLQPQ